MSKNTNLSFLTDYITADITNGRIGINNASPAYSFDVTGIARTSTSTYLATSGGNVGIGTTSPSVNANQTSLTINGTNNSRLDMQVSGTRNAGFVVASDAAYLETTAAIPLVLYTNSAERMRILSGGNVGIGTTTPGYPLTVNGTVNAGNFLSSTAIPTIQINTWTTFYTMPAEVGIFSVIIGLGTNDMATWYAYGTVFCNGASGVFLSSFNSTLVSLRTSGLNIQVLLGAGAGFARELTYKILRT